MNFRKRIREVLTRAPAFGAASPNARTFSETADIPLADVWELYKRDPTCKSSVDLLAASTVGIGFYTTVNEKYAQAKEAKALVDKFNKDANLDRLLNRMAKRLIACGNDFWLKTSDTEVIRLPLDAVEKIEFSSVHDQESKQDLKIPYKVTGYKLRAKYGRQILKPEVVIHWQLDSDVPGGFGVGLLQVLLHTLTVNSDKRPAYAWMKSKIEKIMPKIFEKYAGPDVLATLPKAKEDVIKKFETAIKNRGEEGAWLFYSGEKANLDPVTIDPRARFEYYIDHIVNQFYLGCETPLPRLFSTPGFTEASANAALELQDMLIKPTQRDIKRQVECDFFEPLLKNSFDPDSAQVRLNWGSPETPEINVADMLRAAELGLIRPDEFRKNAVKFGWELSEPKQEADAKEVNGDNGRVE